MTKTEHAQEEAHIISYLEDEAAAAAAAAAITAKDKHCWDESFGL